MQYLFINLKNYHKRTIKSFGNGYRAEALTVVGKRFHQKVPLSRKTFDNQTNHSRRANTDTDDLI